MTGNASVIRLHSADNVVVACRRIEKGSIFVPDGSGALEDIEIGHKIATAAIAAGETVLKYGQAIGCATHDIPIGAHVHLHNLSVTSARRDAERSRHDICEQAPRTFEGFRRTNGKVGVRNYVGVLTSVNCSATVARLIVQAAERTGLLDKYPNVDGVIPITHTSGCAMASSGEGFDMLRRTLWGTAVNPNFGGILVVGLGCEVVQVAVFMKDYGLNNRSDMRALTIQESGGTRSSIEEGLARLAELLAEANGARRETVPASELTIGMQCGGSDAWSGVTANPALGNAADRLVALGATVILSETPEIYGAEHLLYARAASPAIAAKLRARIEWWERYTAINGVQMNSNPGPGNHRGGLTTILEKSLGAAAKSGTSPLEDVVEYGEQLTSRGLVFMDSPGFDPCSATGQVASGANMIVFTTGRGSAFGCKPSPSIKLSSNSEIFQRMEDDIDLDCGTIATGIHSISDKGIDIFELILAVASGKRSKSEDLGYGGAEFVPWLIGATM